MNELLILFFSAFVFGLGATLFTKILAAKFNFVHVPKGERWSNRRVSMGGGIAIFATILVFGSVFCGTKHLLPILAVSAAFSVGLIDDLFSMAPTPKFLALSTIALVLIGNGYRFPIPLTALSWVVSFIWFLGITNSINLLDNMDGISSGVAGIILLVATITGVYFNAEPDLIRFSLIASAAALAFLCFNFSPARIFMGDSGSLLLGMTTATALISLPSPSGVSPAWSEFVIALFTFVPISDTTCVTFSRLIHGRRVSQGGRDHSTHRFVLRGYSERQTAFIMYGYTIASCFAAFTVWKFGNPAFLLSYIIFVGTGLCIGRIFLKMKVYSSPQLLIENKSDDNSIRRIAS